MSSIAYSEKVSTSFVDKVKGIASYLGTDPSYLMQVMKAESNLNPQAQNIQGGRVIATGLIQFVESTAKGLGTSMAALHKMSGMEQLDYVKKYYAPYRNKLHSYFDVYLVTFFPAAIGKPDSYIFSTKNLSASLIARQNPAINVNKDEKITMGEFKQYVKKTVPKSLHSVIFGNPMASIIVVVVLITAIYFLTM